MKRVVRWLLARHPRFADVVDVVVVEFANPDNQAVLDRFILEGVEMPRKELAVVWRDATNPETWESPVYEEFLRAVRETNLRLPRDERVRVIPRRHARRIPLFRCRLRFGCSRRCAGARSGIRRRAATAEAAPGRSAKTPASAVA